MAHQPTTNLTSLFGTLVWGDFGPLTLYRDHRGQITAYAKTYPEKPPSPDQLANRARFTAAATAWNALAPQKREQWALAARVASLCAHGYDLFVHWQLTGDDAAIATLARQTGASIP